MEVTDYDKHSSIYNMESMEQRALKKCKQLFEYQHLLLLRDI